LFTVGLAALAILSLVTIGFLDYQGYRLKEVIIKGQPTPKPLKGQPTSTPTTIVPSPTVTPKPSAYYYLEIRLKTLGKEPPQEKYYSFGNYLLSALNFPKDQSYTKIISKIVFDTRGRNSNEKNFSIYNSNYYLALKEGKIEAPKKFEDEYTVINVYPVKSSLEPYIDSPDYCKTDSDCTIRTNFCTYGSFNYYQEFLEAFGCETVADETDYRYMILDEEKGCYTQVSYGGSKCLNNQCVGQNRKVFCEEIKH
jgi:hypothetical protein